MGQGVRLKPSGRDESPDESDRARDDLKGMCRGERKSEIYKTTNKDLDH